MRRRTRSTPAVIAACIAAASHAAVVAAADIEIKGDDCAPQVQLVVHDAPLADVLKQLARTLAFELSYESERNPTLTLSATRPAVELVARLAPSENVSIVQARNPRCPERQRIAKVWVLSTKAGDRTPTTRPPPHPALGTKRDLHPRNADEILSELQRAHGIDPEQARREAGQLPATNH
jgi:hypothetical protein